MVAESLQRQYQLNLKLLTCAAAGDTVGLEQALTQGAQVNYHDDDEQTALHLACIHHHEACAKTLLVYGAKFFWQDNEGKTAYDYLCREKHSALYQDFTFMLDKAAILTPALDADTLLRKLSFLRGGEFTVITQFCQRWQTLATDNQRWWQLTQLAALSRESYDLRSNYRQLFLAFYAQLFSRSELTAREKQFVVACIIGDVDKLTELQQEDSSIVPATLQVQGYHLLHYAAMKNHPAMCAKLLALGCDLTVTTEGQKTPLCLAVENNAVAATELLLSQQADLQHQDKLGNHVLLVATRKGYLPLVKLLLQQPQCDLEAKNYQGENALIMAAKYHRYALAEFLLSQQAQPDSVDNEGNSALFFAAQHNDIKLLQLLIAAGATVNLVNKHGQTALFYATQAGHLNAVQCLVAAEADVNHCNQSGENIFTIAAYQGYTDIANFLLNMGADINESLRRLFVAGVIRLPQATRMREWLVDNVE